MMIGLVMIRCFDSVMKRERESNLSALIIRWYDSSLFVPLLETYAIFKRSLALSVNKCKIKSPCLNFIEGISCDFASASFALNSL